MFKKVYQIKSNDITSFSTFEYLNVLAKSADVCFNIIVFYRPPDTPFRLFIDEFSTLLEQVVLLSDYPVIVGDFNIHVDKPNVSEASDFNSLLSSFGLVQRIDFPTHRNGHTLDLVITKQCETSLTGTGFELMDPLLSDHVIVKFKISLMKRPHVRKWIMYRKLKSLSRPA